MTSFGTVQRCAGALLVTIALAACSSAGTPVETYAALEFGTSRPVSVDEYAGSPVLLAGWATWCVPCERELPELDEFDDDRADDDLMVIAVNVDGPFVADTEIEAMLTRLDVSLPVWRDADGVLLTQFGGTTMPFSVLLDRDGQVAATWIGAIDVDDDDFLATIEAVSG